MSHHFLNGLPPPLSLMVHKSSELEGGEQIC